MQVGRRRHPVENSVTWSYQLTVAPGGAGSGDDRRRARPRRRPGPVVECGPGARRRAVGRAAACAAPAARTQPVPARHVRRRRADRSRSRSSSSATGGVPPRRRRQEEGLRGRAGDGDLVPVPRPSRQSNFQPMTQPKSDGFWMEEIPSTNPPGRLAFTDQVEGGQHYQVAVVLQRALFPLAPGKLTVTPMEAEVSRTPTSSGARSTRGGSSPSRSRSRPSRCPQRRAAGRFPGGQRRALHARRRASIAPRWRSATR